MLKQLFSLEFRRKRLLAHAPPGPLRDYLQTPFVSNKVDCRQLDFLAIDLETTGLDVRRDEIVSVGLVVCHGGDIDLKTAQHRVIHVDKAMQENNVVIHGITDDVVMRGEPLQQVLADILKILAGKVMLAHHASIEWGFINKACQQYLGGEFVVPVIDTQKIAARSLERRNQPYQMRDLRLYNLRQQYNLPAYTAHNALSDALATAELFAAQMAEAADKDNWPLKRCLTRL